MSLYKVPEGELKALIKDYERKLKTHNLTSRDRIMGEKACVELRRKGYSVNWWDGKFEIVKNRPEPKPKKGGNDGRQEKGSKGGAFREEAESGEIQAEPRSGEE